jgi:hypothetical protein
LRRFWFRQLRDAPWQISSRELRALQSILSKTHARLLHIYFGQIAVHLLPLIRAWERPSIVSFHGADVLVDMNKPAYREATRQMLNAVNLVLVRSESLRRAVAQIGCDEKKIEIQRTGIPLDEFPFRERNFVAAATASKREADDCRRRAVAWPTSEFGARIKHGGQRFVHGFHFTSATPRNLLRIAYFFTS